MPTRYRSFFWPAVLILAGLVLLFVNTGVIPAERLYQLLDLWPLILIVIGLELLVRRTVHGPAAEVAAALVVLVAVVGAASYVAFAPNPAAAQTLDAATALGAVKEATLEVDAGAASINISSTDNVDEDLFRAHVSYSGAKPEVKFENGKLTISQKGNDFLAFGARRFELDLKLNPSVIWSAEVDTGATTNTIDLSEARLKSLSLNSGAASHEITLGAATASTSIEINGGALTVHIHRPSASPVTVDVSGGAVNLTGDGKEMHGVGHLSYTSSDYSSGGNGYRIDISGGACTVTVDTSG
jgi:hypothetical protein